MFSKLLGMKSSKARSVRRPSLRMEGLEGREVPAVLTVDADGGKMFTSIAAAVAAAGANDTVNVYDAASDYSEQILIPAAKTGLKLRGVEAGVVINSPADATMETVAGANLGGAIIDIRATKVVVEGLTINGATNTDGELYSGIRVVGNGSATIRNNTITGMTTSLDSNFGIAVQVGSFRGTGTKGTAKVESNTITNYLSAGVLVDGANSSASVTSNVITGRDALNGGVAQYGVQVSRSASARVERNTIKDHTAADASFGVYVYDVDGKDVVIAKNNIQNNTTGITVELSNGTCGGNVQLVNNDVFFNDYGIFVSESNGSEVTHNDIKGSTFGGLTVGDSSHVEVENNRIWDSGYDGIYVYNGGGNSIKRNKVYDNGLDATVGGNGILIENSNNNWVWKNITTANTLNGLHVFGGSGNDIWLSDSVSNVLDGILLENTNCATVVGNYLACNGGYGLRLLNSDNAFIALNLVQNNGEGSIFISADSDNVTTIANRTDDGITYGDAVGSANDSAQYLSAVASSDADTSDLE